MMDANLPILSWIEFSLIEPRALHRYVGKKKCVLAIKGNRIINFEDAIKHLPTCKFKSEERSLNLQVHSQWKA